MTKLPLLCLVVLSCARAEVQAPQDRVPAEVRNAVMLGVRAEDGRVGSGWGAPVALGRVLTVHHVAAEGSIFWSKENGQSGTASLLWADGKRELAMVVAEGEAPVPIYSIAKRLPEWGEMVAYRFYIKPGNRPGLSMGRVAGYDSDGDMVIDGMGHPGASGSPVINMRGELCGLVNAGYNQSAAMSTAQSVEEALSILALKVSFRPNVYARPIVGKVPER